MTGFTAALAVKNRSQILLDGLDWKIAYTFHQWRNNDTIEEIEFKFHFPQYDINFSTNKDVYNGDLRNAFNAGISRGLFVVNEETLLINIHSPEEARLYFNNIPGGKQIWIELAELFIGLFPHQTQ